MPILAGGGESTPVAGLTLLQAKCDLLEQSRSRRPSVLEANRDPEVYPDPDRFDIGRESKRSFSFGWGSLFCLGAALARTDVQETQREIAGDTRRIERAGADPR